MKKFYAMAVGAFAALALASCEEEVPVVLPADYSSIPAAVEKGGPKGMYLLNEGAWGKNMCTLDYLNFTNGMYARNIYQERNPNVTLGLGDVGNDIAICDGRLYIVVNQSNKVEVLDAETAVRIGEVEVVNGRSIAFDGKYAYVTSFVGGDGTKGSLVRFNQKTLAVEGSISLGQQPEGIAIKGGYAYVANSGQLSAPNYDHNVSVVDLAQFKLTDSIPVAINMKAVAFDQEGNLWVNSLGNYADVASNLYKVPAKGAGFDAPKAMNVRCSNFTVSKNKVYGYGVTYDSNWNATNSYFQVEASSATIAPFNIPATVNIMSPYCVAVNPDNGDVYITDAKTYTESGELYCFSADGKLKWQTKTGDIPGHIVFYSK